MTTTDFRDDEDDIRRTAREIEEATPEAFAQMVRLLRAQPDAQILGRAEFKARDLAHGISAEVVQAEVTARQFWATKTPP